MRRRVYIASYAVVSRGTSPDVSFVPPLVRRRLSPLQKLFFALAKAVENDPSQLVVFASRDGEDTLTRRTVEDFRADGSVSPHRFSSSVYNAAPGLCSVFTKNRAPYTAIAAGDDTIECGIIELLAGRTPSMFVYAEETDGGYGAAMTLADGGETAVEVGDGDPSLPPVGFDALNSFLHGEATEVKGRFISLRRV